MHARAATKLEIVANQDFCDLNRVESGALAQVYGFTDLDGTRPDWFRYMAEVIEGDGTPGDDGPYR